MSRKFGIEIELVGTTIRRVVDAFREANVALAIDANWHHVNIPNAWDIHSDGSLSSGGFEVVSPILDGEAGLEEVRKVARLLVLAGARVDGTCGFHVHVDARDLTVDHIVNVAARYNHFASEIARFMPTSRRESRWCRNLSDVCTSAQISTMLNRGTEAFHNLDRYRTVNLAAYARHGSIEFRQHNGTVNAEKMENWIRFCTEFVEASNIEPLPIPEIPGTVVPPQVVITMPDGSTRTVDAPNGNPNLRKLAKLNTMFHNSGTDRATGLGNALELSTIMEEYGWNMTVLRANFRFLEELYGRKIYLLNSEGVVLRNEERNNGTHCRASVRSVPTLMDIRLRELRNRHSMPHRELRSIPMDSLFRGISVPVVTYLNERALELSGYECPPEEADDYEDDPYEDEDYDEND